MFVLAIGYNILCLKIMFRVNVEYKNSWKTNGNKIN